MTLKNARKYQQRLINMLFNKHCEREGAVGSVRSGTKSSCSQEIDDFVTLNISSDCNIAVEDLQC